MNVPDGSYSADQAGEPGQQRWFVLGVVGLAQLIGAAMFGIFLFLTYYLQTILGYSPVATGVAFLPTIVMI